MPLPWHSGGKPNPKQLIDLAKKIRVSKEKNSLYRRYESR